MRISSYFLIAVGGAVIGAASGFAWRAYDSAGQPAIPTPIEAVQQVDTLPAFSYPDLDGRPRFHDEFGGKVMVLNFWASWCPPCRKETPTFVALQEAYAADVQFVGIAIDGGALASEAQRAADLGVGTVLVQRPATTGLAEGIAILGEIGPPVLIICRHDATDRGKRFWHLVSLHVRQVVSAASDEGRPLALPERKIATLRYG